MLGTRIDDPDGLESDAGSSAGLGWLAMTTRLIPGKQLRNVQGVFLPTDTAIHGYEIHNGITEGAALSLPMLRLNGNPDGAVSEDGQVMGCYLHGLFDSAEAGNAILQWAGLRSERAVDYDAHRQKDLDRLAEMIDQHLDTEKLLSAIGADR